MSKQELTLEQCQTIRGGSVEGGIVGGFIGGFVGSLLAIPAGVASAGFGTAVSIGATAAGAAIGANVS